MRYAGQRVQVDVKAVPRECILDKSWKRYYQYTAIDEYSRLRYLEAFQTADTFSSALFIEHATAWFARKGIRIECVHIRFKHWFKKLKLFFMVSLRVELFKRVGYIFLVQD